MGGAHCNGGHCSGGALRVGGCAAEGGALQWGAARAPGVGWPRRVPQSLSSGGVHALAPLWGCLCRRGGPGPAGRVPAGGAARPRMAPRGAAHPTASPTAAGGPGLEPPQPAAPAWGGPSCPTGASQPPSPPRCEGQRGFTRLHPHPPRLQPGISVMSCAASASGGAGGLQPPPPPSPSHASHVGEGRVTAITRGLPMNREGNGGGLAGLGAAHALGRRGVHTPGICGGGELLARGREFSPVPPPPLPGP